MICMRGTKLKILVSICILICKSVVKRPVESFTIKSKNVTFPISDFKIIHKYARVRRCKLCTNVYIGGHKWSHDNMIYIYIYIYIYSLILALILIHVAYGVHKPISIRSLRWLENNHMKMTVIHSGVIETWVKTRHLCVLVWYFYS